MKRGKTSETNPNTERSKLPVIIIISAAAVILTVVIVLLALYFTGPKRAVKRYTGASFSKKGGKTYLSLVLTENIEDQLKEDDKWESNIEAYNDFVSDNTEGLKYKVKKVRKGKKLSDSALSGAENYFRKLSESYNSAHDYLKIKKGYEFTIKYKCKNKKEKTEENHELTICAVKVDKQDWKIIERSAAELEKISGNSNADTDTQGFSLFKF